MFVLAHLFSLLTALNIPATPFATPCAPIANTVQSVARDYPECVDEYGTDGLSGLDADELADACESW